MEKPKARIESLLVREGQEFELDWNDTVVKVHSCYEQTERTTLHELTIVRRG